MALQRRSPLVPCSAMSPVPQGLVLVSVSPVCVACVLLLCLAAFLSCPDIYIGSRCCGRYLVPSRGGAHFNKVHAGLFVKWDLPLLPPEPRPCKCVGWETWNWWGFVPVFWWRGLLHQDWGKREWKGQIYQRMGGQDHVIKLGCSVHTVLVPTFSLVLMLDTKKEEGIYQIKSSEKVK